jgi:hypothetical protein
MRFIPTWLHGIVDYLTVGTLFAAPRILKWDKASTTTMTAAAGGLLGYSLITRYELGVFKWLPMPGHLAMDAASGAALCAAPFMLPLKKKQRGMITTGFLMFGVMELFFALFTKTQPVLLEPEAYVEQDLVESLQGQLS